MTSPPPVWPGAHSDASTRSYWREEALTRIAELAAVTAWLESRSSRGNTVGDPSVSLVYRHLEAARAAAEGHRRASLRRRLTATFGADLERATSNLDAAEVQLLRLAPPEYLQGQIPGVLAAVRARLPAGDPQRTRMEQISARAGDRELALYERNAIVAALHTARAEARRGMIRVRSFRNLVLVVALIMTVAVTGVMLLGANDPAVLPLCFQPAGDVVCPTGAVVSVGESASAAEVERAIRIAVSPWDLPLVALIGAIAGAFAAATALRAVRGTSTPYGLPVALAVLKVPAGALTAILGLLLMRGQFIPGLTALESPSQILAWAVVFGYAQQLFTRLVDRQAQAVLDEAGERSEDLPAGVSDVTPEAVAGEVATSVKRSFTPPPLVNYRGVLSVKLLDSDGRQLPMPRNGQSVLAAPAVDRVQVVIGTNPEPDTLQVPIAIEQGESASVVSFGVEIDSETVTFAPRNQFVEVEPDGPSRRVEFSIEPTHPIVTGSAWVRLTQRGRLIQLVEVKLA